MRRIFLGLDNNADDFFSDISKHILDQLGHTADSLRTGEPSKYHLLIFGIADQISRECYQRVLVSICTFKAPQASIPAVW